MKCNIIGAGRLGKNIALALNASGIAEIQAIYNSHWESAQKVCQDIGTGQAIHRLEQLPYADITWITTNDDSIQSIANQLAQNSLIKPGSFIVHCSGVLDSSSLASLKALDCSIASLHPLKAFKEDYLHQEAFNQVDCVLEGDAPVCEWLRNTFTSLGANVLTINAQAKAAYHAAACIASNYLLTLASCSEELLLTAGISQEQSRAMICKLMQGNITNLMTSKEISETLTGPLMRGDFKTISLHLQAINNPITKELYKSAGLATLALTPLEEDITHQITNILTN